MANSILIANLEDLLEEAKTNPDFNLAAELSALGEAISKGDAE